MLAEQLTRFCALMSLDQSMVRSAEQVERFGLAVSLRVSQLLVAKREDYEAFCQAFGTSLTLTIQRDDVPFLEIGGGILPDEIDTFLQELQSFQPDIRLDLQLQINKRILIGNLGIDRPAYHTIFLFFTDRLEAILSAAVTTQAKELFAGAYHPTLIVVSEAMFAFRGGMLSICGEQDAAKYATMIVQPQDDIQRHLEQYTAFAREHVNWSGFHLDNLTPLHYLGKWERLDSNPERVRHLLYRNILHLFILHTANRTVQAGSQFESVFSSAEQTILMRLGSDGIDDSRAEYLPRLVSWTVDGQGTDRLAVLRSVVSRAIDEDDAIQNYERVAKRLRQLFADVTWHYQVFVDGKIGKHFDELEKVADDTARVSAEVSGTIDTVTKGLTDALLATVGAVVASFLAALLENKTQGTIFQITMRIYASYLIFYMVYQLGSILWSYILLISEANQRFIVYSDRLGEERISKIRVSLQRRQRQFRVLLSITLITYILLAVAVIWSSTRVPQILVQRGIIAPVPTGSPTSPAQSTPAPGALPVP